ncbi:hypothetical protein NL676_029823 [Syzygium grande]|nr:hypothetical protein NL676_029823 [Syzygium grande]
MEFLECVPEECWKSLTSLESLSISVCPGLTSLSKAPPPLLGTRHQSNEVDLDSSDSKELDLSNYNETSGGKDILELRSLRSVCIESLPKLASLPQWLLQLSNLEDLSIRFCSELDLCNNNNNLILDLHGGLQRSPLRESLSRPKTGVSPAGASTGQKSRASHNLGLLQFEGITRSRSRPFNHFESSESGLAPC